MKILIADDEGDLRDTLRDLFEDEGHRVSTAANGAMALEALEEEPELPDLLILDLVMPVVDGWEVYQRMQGDPRLSRVPIIVSTSDPSRAPPGLPVAKKPLDMKRLLRAVRRLSAPGGACGGGPSITGT